LKTKLLILLLNLAALPLIAGNSILSFDGYPIQYFGKDIYSLGMGDTGASDIFRNNTGYANPAMHNMNNRSLFSTGILPGYNAYRSRDSLGTESRYIDNSLDFPFFSLSIPLKRHRLGFQFSSYTAGTVANEREFLLPDSTEITEEHGMDRYIYRVDLIYSVSLGRHNLGVSGNYYFGHEVRDFTQTSEAWLYNTHEEIARDYKNPSFTAGYLYHWDKIALGAHYTMGVTLKGEEVRSSTHETEDPVAYEFKVPSQYAVSVTALPYPEFKVAADAHYETWSAIDTAKYTDGYKAGLGLAYEPEAANERRGLLSLPWRTGISWRHLPFEVDDQEVSELALSLGASLPLKGDVNRIDLGFQYAKRGNLERNGLSDNSFLLMFGFTGFDILGKAPDRTAPREIPEKEDIGTW
jgi:hypothetical protein